MLFHLCNVSFVGKPWKTKPPKGLKDIHLLDRSVWWVVLARGRGARFGVVCSPWCSLPASGSSAKSGFPSVSFSSLNAVVRERQAHKPQLGLAPLQVVL